MATVRLKALAQAITRHPWSSLQDALLLAMAMLVSALLALQYNLFSSIAELSDPKREISLSEAVFLTILLAFCIVAFISDASTRSGVMLHAKSPQKLGEGVQVASIARFCNKSSEPSFDAQSVDDSNVFAQFQWAEACVSSY